ncbi:MAG: hypothetical protein SGJ19_25175 [Planctomycetia bacterium]|nr:hypothetical protein [Planctomycetia bacterium]
MDSPRAFRHGLLVALFFASLTGCGGSGLPGTVPIRGKIFYQRKVLTAGTVLYSPVNDSGRQARGELQSDGTFTLTTLEANDGALPGEYRVVILAYAPHPGEPGRGDVPADAPPPTIERGFVIPEKYTTPEETPFTDKVDDQHPGFREWSIE